MGGCTSPKGEGGEADSSPLPAQTAAIWRLSQARAELITALGKQGRAKRVLCKEGTWCPPFPGMGPKAWGSRKPAPPPSRTRKGQGARFGSKETWQQREGEGGERPTGPHRSSKEEEEVLRH